MNFKSAQIFLSWALFMSHSRQ